MVSSGNERRKSRIPSAIPRSLFRRGNFVAEILEDRRAAIFYCLIQRGGSSEVLFYCQSASAAEIERLAKDQLRYYEQNQCNAAGKKAAGGRYGP